MCGLRFVIERLPRFQDRLKFNLGDRRELRTPFLKLYTFSSGPFSPSTGAREHLPSAEPAPRSSLDMSLLK
jgi:hypothetical protein